MPPGAGPATPARRVAGRPARPAQRQRRQRRAARGRDPATPFPRRVEPAPPPKPNEFQRFVEGATGRLLPIFGSTFFADAADTFQSLDNVPVSADYTIGPGDEIVIRAWGAIDVDYRSHGRPQRHAQPAQGRQLQRRRRQGRRTSRSNLRAQIGAAVHQLRSRGLARPAARPARVRRRPGAAARACTPCRASRRCCRRWSPRAARARSGSMRKILLRRDGTVISELDVYEFLVPGRQVEGRPARRRRRRRLPAGGPARRPHRLDRHAGDLRAEERRRSRSARCCATPAARRCSPIRTGSQLERIDPTQPLATRFVETFRPRRAPACRSRCATATC